MHEHHVCITVIKRLSFYNLNGIHFVCCYTWMYDQFRNMFMYKNQCYTTLHFWYAAASIDFLSITIFIFLAGYKFSGSDFSCETPVGNHWFKLFYIWDNNYFIYSSTSFVLRNSVKNNRIYYHFFIYIYY